MMTLREALTAAGIDGCDVCDEDWDWGIYVPLPEEGSDDPYDRFCAMLCDNLHTNALNLDWYTPVDACRFVESHRAAFDRFLNEANREGCRPCDFDKPLKSDEDRGYHEVYMDSLEQLIAGNYPNEDYEILVGYLS